MAPTVEAGSVDATLEKTVAESYEGTAWDAFVRRLARELCLAALDMLVQEVGTTGLAGMSVDAFTVAVTTGDHGSHRPSPGAPHPPSDTHG